MGGRLGLVLRSVGEDRFIVQQLTLAIQADQFAAGAVARIDAHDPFGAQGGCQKQLTQVVGEDADGSASARSLRATRTSVSMLRDKRRL